MRKKFSLVNNCVMINIEIIRYNIQIQTTAIILFKFKQYSGNETQLKAFTFIFTD